MDAEDCEVFCGAAATGIALELNHRYEWYTNALRMLSHGDYTKIEENGAKIQRAFLAFEKCTASCPEEEKELADMTSEDYSELVGRWYDSMRQKEASV
jgi:hypothetical protein